MARARARFVVVEQQQWQDFFCPVKCSRYEVFLWYILFSLRFRCLFVPPCFSVGALLC